MSTKLKISEDMSIPVDAVTETFGIMGRRGSGKSHTGAVMAEEMLSHGIPIIAYDPTGAWYGLKSSIDGKSAGFPVVIFGGEHEDVPLAETDGEMVAKAIVSERFPAILDCSLLRKGARLRFMADFLETLYHQNREAVHFFADELHTIAPLVLRNVGEASVFQSRCVGAIEDIILQGRRRGIGMTGISQRPALVNANVRSQFGTLVAMQIVAPLDRKAIAEWIAEKGTEEEGERLLQQLPRLDRGTGIVWSPTFDILKTVKFRARRTFDSGRTPGIGERRVEPKVWADIDVDKLGKAIAAKREEKKANDPATLKRRIAELERMANKPAPAPAATEPKIIEVPVLKNGQLDRTEKVATRLETFAAKFNDRLAELVGSVNAEVGELRKMIAPAAAPRPAVPPVRPVMAPRPVAAARPVVRREVTTPAGSGEHLPDGERKILTAAAQYPGGVDPEQLSVLTGYKRSSRDAYLQRLRGKGYVDRVGDKIVALDAGIAALGDFEPLPTGEQLREYWIARLPEGERRILEVLIEHFPNAVDRDSLDVPTGYKRSSRDAYLQRLAARKLVENVGRGCVRARETLFDGVPA